MTRKVPSARPDERDYLVVELKAPSVKIGQKETGQVRSYAFAVQDDERFRNIKARWEFWVVSNYRKNKNKILLIRIVATRGDDLAPAKRIP
jgi:hypothetical protein